MDATTPPAALPPDAVQVINVRLIPCRTAQGNTAQMVLTDWVNQSRSPITAVFAEIIAYDASGKPLDSGAPDYCIFAVDRPSQAVQPGQTYTEPDDSGFMLLSHFYGEAARATVRILRVR